MELIFTENLAYLHNSLILVLSCAQVLIVYCLSATHRPPRGVGLFTAYFMASLMGWILLSLQYNTGIPAIQHKLAAIIAIVSGYLLFLATGQRTRITRGRYLFGLICLAAISCTFLTSTQGMFLPGLACAALFALAAGIFSAYQAWQQRNIGDAITACAAGLMVIGLGMAAGKSGANGSPQHSAMIVLGSYSIASALVIVGFLASIIIDYQQRLTRQSTEDPLTRILNRRGLEDAIFVTLTSAARHNTATSAIMLDIEHFQQINDSFGHDVGDRVLQQLSCTLCQTCRASDVIARIGGKLFMVVMPDTDSNSAQILAERIRSTVVAQAMRIDGHNINITVNIGLTTANGEISLDDLQRAAEHAVHTARRNGRNRVAMVDSRSRHYASHRPAMGKAQ
ncbi:MAG: GGDEF domain-containing protein [Parahaliea sp.]